MRNGPITWNPSRCSDHGGIAGKVIQFSGYLKNCGFRVFSSNVMHALRGLDQINLLHREDFFNVLRSHLVSCQEEWERFSELFEDFWQESEQEGEEDNRDGGSASGEGRTWEPRLDMLSEQGSVENNTCQDPSFMGMTYSPVACLERKNLSSLNAHDVKAAQLLLKQLISPFRISLTRRFKSSRRPANMDFPRVLKSSLKTAGIPLVLFYKRRKKRLKRLVIITDVSGSMDRYARFVMPFIMGFKGMGTKAEVFVFSTSLTSITHVLRRFSVDEALQGISELVPDWSGGTRIGYSLHQFTQQQGERLLNKRTVVVIMSDGWDLGARDLLKREMKLLNQKVHRIIWLNPLAGDADYEPVCQGMQTALPYVDYFLPADSLQSLKRVGRVLSKVMFH